ncbi:unnamed protein product [marine sediment metagenome]|uniref:Uncharacterized protein n=1 Tax=marine sediment metagenome TaxID=412755 RepID=X1HK70_9ZZZZ
MSENEQENEIKYDLIRGIRTENNQEIIDFLKEKGYKFEIFEYKDFSPYQTKEDIEQEPPLVEIKQEYYDNLKMISELTNLSITLMVNSSLHDFFHFIKEQPEYFLDGFFGDLNLLDIFSLIYSKMRGE